MTGNDWVWQLAQVLFKYSCGIMNTTHVQSQQNSPSIWKVAGVSQTSRQKSVGITKHHFHVVPRGSSKWPGGLGPRPSLRHFRHVLLNDLFTSMMMFENFQRGFQVFWSESWNFPRAGDLTFLICINIFNLHVWPFWATVHYSYHLLSKLFTLIKCCS